MAELERMIEISSDENVWPDHALKDLPREQREILICCWLEPPSATEIEIMQRAEKEVARKMWLRKCKAICAVSEMIKESLDVSKAIADDLAKHFAGVGNIHYTITPAQWKCGQRTYYRRLNAASREIARALFKAVQCQARRRR